MFSAQTKPWEHCMAGGQALGPRVTADKAAAAGKGGGGRCRGPTTSEPTSNEMHKYMHEHRAKENLTAR